MKEKLLLPVAGLFVFGLMFIPSISSAQSTTTTVQINSISALLQQMQALQKQIEALKASQKSLQVQASTEFNAFVTNLSLGSRGDAVLALQALLAANPDIYPEGLITGFFGKSTEKALKRLQERNGLEQVGHVGPKTRALLNRLLEDNPVAFESEDDDDGDDVDDDSNNHRQRGRGKGEGKRPCANVPPGRIIAQGWLKKQDGERPLVPECQRLPKGIEKKGDDFKQGSTTPDTVAPIVRDLLVRDIASTTALIKWQTNEKATSTLWYSTTSPLNTSTATKLEGSTFVTSHTFNLSGLTASTTYYFQIKVSDKSNNSFISTGRSFVTTGN